MRGLACLSFAFVMDLFLNESCHIPYHAYLHEKIYKLRNIKGGASGIGLGTVKLLLDNHAYVVVGDLNTMPITHDRLTFLKTNVTAWADLSALFKLAKYHFNHLTILKGIDLIHYYISLA